MMPGKIKQGQSIFIPFRNGMSISDSQNKARMYMSVEKFKASFPAFRLGTEDIELVEYAPVRQGRWIDRMVRDWACSECGGLIQKVRNVDGYCYDDKPNYCPDCGCKMEG